MKVKEKGLDQSSIQRSDKAGTPSSSNNNGKPSFSGPRTFGKFNAFHELDRIKQNGGRLPDYILKEQRGITVGYEMKGTGASGSGEGKRKRDGQDEAAAEKKAKKVSVAWTEEAQNNVILSSLADR